MMHVEASRGQLSERMNQEIGRLSEKIENKHDQVVQVLTNLFGSAAKGEIKK